MEFNSENRFNRNTALIALVSALIGLILLIGTKVSNYYSKEKRQLRTIEAASNELIRNQCTAIESNSNQIKFISVEFRPWSQGWRNWDFPTKAFNYKDDGAIEALIYDVEMNPEIQSIWRFKLSENTHLFQAKVPIESNVNIHGCWKLVHHEKNLSNLDKYGVSHKIKERKYFFLYLNN